MGVKAGFRKLDRLIGKVWRSFSADENPPSVLPVGRRIGLRVQAVRLGQPPALWTYPESDRNSNSDTYRSVLSEHDRTTCIPPASESAPDSNIPQPAQPRRNTCAGTHAIREVTSRRRCYGGIVRYAGSLPMHKEHPTHYDAHFAVDTVIAFLRSIRADPYGRWRNPQPSGTGVPKFSSFSGGGNGQCWSYRSQGRPVNRGPRDGRQGFTSSDIRQHNRSLISLTDLDHFVILGVGIVPGEPGPRATPMAAIRRSTFDVAIAWSIIHFSRTILSADIPLSVPCLAARYKGGGSLGGGICAESLLDLQIRQAFDFQYAPGKHVLLPFSRASRAPLHRHVGYGVHQVSR